MLKLQHVAIGTMISHMLILTFSLHACPLFVFKNITFQYANFIAALSLWPVSVCTWSLSTRDENNNCLWCHSWRSVVFLFSSSPWEDTMSGLHRWAGLFLENLCSNFRLEQIMSVFSFLKARLSQFQISVWLMDIKVPEQVCIEFTRRTQERGGDIYIWQRQEEVKCKYLLWLMWAVMSSNDYKQPSTNTTNNNRICDNEKCRI